MNIKALNSFSGVISMYEGEERDVAASAAKELISAGHAKEIKIKAVIENETE